MHWRAAAFLVVLLAAPAHPAEPPPRPAGTVFDLLTRVAADPSPPDGVRVVFRGAHKETRTSVRMASPGAVSYPVSIPPEAVLTLGFAQSASAFMVETPDLAEPTRLRVTFTEPDGTEHVLLERNLDLRHVESDRRWFDERIDLEPLAGKKGTLTFEARNEGDAEKARQSDIFWSAPRIVVDAGENPNLLFITIDCLRADHVGSYGYEPDVTPHLDALAAEGIRFGHAFANAPMTLPSIPQIFTSRVFPTRDHETLTNPIARAGISSAAYVNNAWIPLWLSQGGHAEPPGTFDRLVSGELDAKAITDLALHWLEKRPSERFALYLHYLDAHTPYRPPAEYIARFGDPDYHGPVGDRFNDSEGADHGKYDAADRARIVALYDASIRYIDDQIGRLLGALRKSGRLEHTLVVVTADHGEEFWDHGHFFHGQSLYDELLHIPLIVRLPGAAKKGVVVDRPVRAIDIAPSILEWLRLPEPSGFTGGSLATAMATPDKEGPPLFATATQAQFPTRYAVRTRSQKLIESLDSGRRELYDVAHDPREQRDEGADGLTAAAPLAAELDEARTALRSRGYQVHVVGPRSGKATVHVRLAGHPKSGTFLTLDRRGEGGSPALSLTPDGMNLDASLTVDAAGGGFRFDRLPDPRNLGHKDLVRVTVEVDGESAGKQVVSLGPTGRTPRTAMIDLRNRSLESDTAPSCPAPAEGVRVCLWRFPGEKFGSVPEIKDPAVREKLRALGYLQ